MFRRFTYSMAFLAAIVMLTAGSCTQQKLTVSPKTQTLTAGGASATFSATLENASATIAWKLEPALGTLSGSTGTSVLYTPPASLATPTSVRLTASAGTISDVATLSLSPAATAESYVVLPAPNPTAPAKTAKLPVKLEKDYAVYQGDILFPKSAVVQPNAIRPQGNRMQDGYCRAEFAICWDKSYLWPNKTLPYTFDAGVGMPLRSVVQQAAQVYLDRSGIRLIESGAYEDRVIIKQLDPSSPEGGSSAVGRVNGEQEMFFQPDAPLSTVLHEFGHALGLWHEQSRADRNSFIRILENNIESDFMHNYRLIDDPDMAHIDGPYDFLSIMHYRALDSGFAKKDAAGKRLPTFELVNPNAGIDLAKVGNATDLSPGDVLALANLYDAPVTSGSIRLVVRGPGTLLNGGTARLEVEVVNAGPRDMRDLYFGVEAKANTPFTMSSGGGLACGATNGNVAGNPILCYVPIGPNSGQSRRYGPITLEVPANAPSQTITITLGVRPIGTRLADPSKGISKVRLEQIRIDPDFYEVDNSPQTARILPLWNTQQRTLHQASDVDYLQVDAPDASETNAYVLSLDGQDTLTLEQEWFKSDGTPFAPEGGQYVLTPGRYFVRVSGKLTRYQAQLSVINYKKLKNYLLNLPAVVLAFKWDGPSIARVLNQPFDTISVSGSGLRSIRVKGDNLQLAIYDQFGEIYGRGARGVDGLLQIDVPSSDEASEKQFFLKVERESNSIVEGNLVIEQPSVGYSMAGCTSFTRNCPNP